MQILSSHVFALVLQKVPTTPSAQATTQKKSPATNEQANISERIPPFYFPFGNPNQTGTFLAAGRYYTGYFLPLGKTRGIVTPRQNEGYCHHK